MMSKTLRLVLTTAGLAMTAAPTQAMPFLSSADRSPMIMQVANGCGPGRYRGPGGACHPFGRGPYPGGYWGPYRYPYGAPYRLVYGGNGCPPGYWRGPWGHCRNTPYHGRLPGGGWQ